MGKKSKKKNAVKTKAGPSSLPANAQEAEGEVAASGGAIGGILTSISGGSNRKQRCISCLALLKDLAKAHQCPGCSLLYCWRCEKKDFQTCPNGGGCARSLRRCLRCFSGGTMEKELILAGVLPPDPPLGTRTSEDLSSYRKYDTQTLWSSYKAYAGLIAGREDLTMDSVPIFYCMSKTCLAGSSENMMTKIECLPCAQNSPTSRLLHCSRCGKLRCQACLLNAFNSMKASSPFQAATYKAFQICSVGKGGKKAEALLCEVISASNPDIYSRCNTCDTDLCFGCMDQVEFEQVARETLTAATVGGNYKVEYHCRKCYWSTKPCTNPNCPNDAGIATKRCGGCHLNRYCSVECQAAAYPDHVGRCERIKAKRAAAAGKSKED